MLILGVEPSQWTYKDHMRTDTLYELVLISKQKIIYYYDASTTFSASLRNSPDLRSSEFSSDFKFAYVIIYDFYLYPFLRNTFHIHRRIYQIDRILRHNNEISIMFENFHDWTGIFVYTFDQEFFLVFFYTN